MVNILCFSKVRNFQIVQRLGQPTSWRHEDHEHQTGDTVTETGHYVDKDGEHVDLTQGDAFPNCPKTNQATIWKHAQ